MKKFLLLASLIPALSFCDQVESTAFKGLNNNENSVIIDPAYAQDLLNVDVTPGGKSFKKRSGYGVYKALSTSKATHGGFHSFDSTGNDVQIWGSSTSLYGIVADGTPLQLVSSATLASTWDCTDTQGSSYCVDSNRDAYIKTNGTTMTWFTTPLGTMVESTPDRVIVAGVSGTPNTLYVSQSNTFTNFTTGVNATDAFTEVIASPGSKLTHIRWGCGKVLWWKDQSFGYFDFEDQYQASIKTVSDTIGTFDNTSAIDPGGSVWFRGQDGHTWKYDCSILTKETIDITPDIQAAGKRVSNSWTQATQADFQTGASTPTANLSFTISPGDVIVSSFGATESILLASMTYNSQNVNNNSFESGGSTNWTVTGVFTNSGTNGGVSPQDGSLMELEACNCTAALVNAVTGSTIATVSAAQVANTWTLNTITVGAANAGNIANINIACSFGSLRSDNFVLNGNNVQFYSNQSSTNFNCFIDNFTNSPKSSSQTYTSATFDTAFTSSTIQLQTSRVLTTAPIFSVQTSTFSSGGFAEILTTTGTNATSKRYALYKTTYSFVLADYPLVPVSANVLLARSSGTYLSTVKNAPNLTAWSTLGINYSNNGGTHSFFMRSSTNSFSITSSTPSWTAQTSGGLITISTGTYFQFADTFTVTAATQTPTLNDFSVYWFEGSAADQAYMLYFDNAIWESVAFGSGQATNNYIFKYDLINEGWTLYNFGAGGLLVQSNTLYFGDSSTSGANVFNYGTATSDNGTAIQAFWRSKSYTGADPFLQAQLTNIDVFAKKDSGTTLTGTYTTDTSTATAYSILLSTSNAVVQSRKLLPAGKLGYVWDFKLGDTSASSAWEVLGYRIGFTQLPYRPTTP